MAGLSLAVGGFGGGGAAAGNGGLPVAANSPTGTTIGRAAFGISAGQAAPGPRTAAYGTLIAGAAGTILLAWLWWTLPR
ncbi:MAG: hypothetical protein M0030_29110 [Actinomycetota bacterium]|nr:hypothetical protein [Actinomycetota bacterium]